MRHDEAFKILLQARPADIVEAFAPELAASYGDPAGVQIESVEVLPRVKGLRRSRFMDFAVTVRWPGPGDATGRAVLILTEHFSSPNTVELSRVALYTAAMMHRHPGVPVLPVVVVGGSRGRPVADHLVDSVAGFTVLDFRCRLFLVDVDCLPAWDRARSPLLAVLAALMRDQPKVQVAYRAVQTLRASRQGMALLSTLLPLIEHLASLNAAALDELYTLLSEEPDMISVVDMFRAEGKAEGKTEGQITTILELFADGDLTADRARARLQHLSDQQQISSEQLATALAQIAST